MDYKRILTIQDISCVGQCSLTVALPVLSACGLETCILPSAVLSTHTGGFTGFTFRDLTDDMPLILRHWQSEGIRFDAVYTGYLGSARQAGYVRDIIAATARGDFLSIVDPAMADNGRLYTGFDDGFVEAMRGLCLSAQIMLPNLTEACLLTGTEYREQYGECYISGLVERLHAAGAGTVVLTGVSFSPETTGVLVAPRDGPAEYYRHRRIDACCHGTGDIFASAFTGALLSSFPLPDCARIAADFTLESIERTIGDPEHWYGVKFELALPRLMRLLGRI